MCWRMAASGSASTGSGSGRTRAPACPSSKSDRTRSCLVDLCRRDRLSGSSAADWRSVRHGRTGPGRPARPGRKDPFAMQVIEGAGIYTPAKDGELNHWIEHLVTEDLSMGTYSIPAGGLDDQRPHYEDEIYVVQTGIATLVTDSGSAEARP